MRAILFVLTLAGCSTVPMEHHDDYSSLADYLQRGYSPPELTRYSYFGKEIPALELSVGNTHLTYVGDAWGEGYYLRVSAPLVGGATRERVFCSLYGSDVLGAYSEGTLNPSGEIIAYATWFRGENTSGAQGKEWEELQKWFAQVRAEFVVRAGNNSRYRDAVAHMN